jgi:putative phosphoribosyl transferase
MPAEPPPIRLTDRREAGRRLAERLSGPAPERPLILGLTRGGVPLAFEIAQRLDAPLDVLVARKIGQPGNPEYGLGAVVEGGFCYLDLPRVREAGLTESDLAPILRRETTLADRAARRYRGGQRRRDVAGRSIVLVDDGVATGGTVIAAVRSLRHEGSGPITVGLGVGPPDAIERLGREADRVVVVLQPRAFYAVGEWYETFEAVSDELVLRLLTEARDREGKR